MKILRFAILMLLLAGMMRVAANAQRNQPQARPDLMSTLLDLDRTAAATNSDISHLQIDKWKGGWKTGFTTSSSHKNQAGATAVSIQRNLKSELPERVREAINSRGGMLATFKVYEDVNLVCQSLDQLIGVGQEYGRKEEVDPLMNDYNNLARLRKQISLYIQQRAAALDGVSPGAAASSSSYTVVPMGDGPNATRKIVVDDSAPERRPAASEKKKKAVIQYSDQ